MKQHVQVHKPIVTTILPVHEQHARASRRQKTKLPPLPGLRNPNQQPRAIPIIKKYGLV